MRKLTVTLAAVSAILMVGSLVADAQTTRGAFSIPKDVNFTPIEKAACGPRPGRWCGPFHTRVCRYGRCWCAHC
jgi:hypothetical protein